MSFPLSQALIRFAVPWLGLDWPLDWGKTFGRAAPLALEIGYGNGEFLVAQAHRHPERNWVGIERAWGSTQRLLRRLSRQGLANVRVLEGDAAWLLVRLFAPDSLGEVFINFSDPWPKARHQGRRLVRPGFVRALGEKLCLGGRVTIATDHPDYAAWIAEVLTGQDVLRSALEAPFVHELADRTPTKYEEKARARGARVYYFVREKVRPTLAATVREEFYNMPNVVLQGQLDLEAALSRLPGRSWRESHRDLEVLIKCLGAFRQLDDAHGLLELLVQEGGLSQRLALGVFVQAGGRVLLKPLSIGYPRPTWGVKRAVWHVARTLVEDQPTLRVASSTVGSWG